MPRLPRLFFPSYKGSYHIISRTISDVKFFSRNEKDEIMKLLIKYASGFYVDIEAFCIMGNHFHILLSTNENDAMCVTKQELIKRYKNIFGKSAEPPEGGQDCYGKHYVDPDGGIKRLYERLTCISTFVKEFKQAVSKWYNRRKNRKGPLWRGRFKSNSILKGDIRLICSSYIELNPVRANIRQFPESYRWSSLGMRVGNPGKARKFLKPIPVSDIEPSISNLSEPFAIRKRRKQEIMELYWYRAFIYEAGAVKREGKGAIPLDIAAQVKEVGGRLNIGGRLQHRMRNLSESIAIGTSNQIVEVQKKLNRELRKPRSFLNDAEWAFNTRCLKEKNNLPE